MVKSEFKVLGKEYLIMHEFNWTGEADIYVFEGGHYRLIATLPGALLTACSREKHLLDAIAAIERLV